MKSASLKGALTSSVSRSGAIDPRGGALYRCETLPNEIGYNDDVDIFNRYSEKIIQIEIITTIIHVC